MKVWLINCFFNLSKWILNHQWKFIGLLLLIAYAIGMYGYWDAIKGAPDEIFVSLERPLSSTMIWAFINMIAGSSDNLSNKWIMISSLISTVALAFVVMITLLKELLVKWKLRVMETLPHTLVIGLGSNNRHYLNSEPDNKNIIIIEVDSANIHIEYYRDRGFGVFVGTLKDFNINFNKLEEVVISTGCDRMNIELSGMILEKIPEEMTREYFGNPVSVHVHLENQNYKELFQQKIMRAKNDLPLEFIPYSFNDDAARALFDQHTILGDYRDLVETDQGYSVVIVGDDNLAERIIYHLCMQANLPNKNVCTIHCISEDSEAFLARIRVKFWGIYNLDFIQLRGHSFGINTPEFYAFYVWKHNNLSNIIICHNDENLNLECATNLYEKVFLRQSVEKTLKVKIHFAIFNLMELGKSIDENKDEFKQYFTFGDAKKICSTEHLIDEKQELIAKLIHFGYAETYNSDQVVDQLSDRIAINDKWYDRSKFSDRESNRSQALHINTKLMSMGLKKVDDAKTDKRELLVANRKMMEPFYEFFVKGTDEITELSSKLYSIDPNDQTKLTQFFHEVMNSDDSFSKLIKAEHERWNTFHFLNGWKQASDGQKIKEAKLHNCLVPLEQFSDVDRQQTIIYDLYATLYIPNYLASSGYRIVPIA